MKTVEDILVEAIAVEIRNIFVCSLREEGISNQIADAAAVRFFAKLQFFLEELSDETAPSSWEGWDIYQ